MWIFFNRGVTSVASKARNQRVEEANNRRFSRDFSIFAQQTTAVTGVPATAVVRIVTAKNFAARHANEGELTSNSLAYAADYDKALDLFMADTSTHAALLATQLATTLASFCNTHE